MKKRHATLVFKDGSTLTVPVEPETVWPEVIHHRILPPGARRREIGRVVRFRYVGCQHGVGAYTEETEA